MKNRIYIVVAILTAISAIIDFSLALINHIMDIIVFVAIIFNKSIMLGSIVMVVAVLAKAHKEDGKDDKRFKTWLIISGVALFVVAIALHFSFNDIVDYITQNGFAWLGSAIMSLTITALAGRAAHDRKYKKK